MKKLYFISVILLLFSIDCLQAQIIEFNSLPKMNYDRFGLGSTNDGNSIYAICGGTGGPPYIVNNIERFDLSMNTWTIISDNLLPRRYCNAEFIESENKIFIFNGEYVNTGVEAYTKRVEILDLQTNQVSFGTENPFPVKSAGSAVWNNKIYFFGGQNQYGYSKRFYVYDVDSKIWSRLPDMPRSMQTKGKIINGILYVIGGYDGSQMQKNIYEYNLETSTWSLTGELPTRISAHALTSDGNNIWLIGSYEDLNYLAAFNIQSKIITNHKSNLIGRRHAAVEYLNDRIYVLGGTQSSNVISSLANFEYAELSKLK